MLWSRNVSRGDVRVDLVEDVGKGDHGAGPLREFDRHTAPFELHELTEDDLGFGLGLRAHAERPQPDLERLHLTVMVGAPDVDEMLPPASDLVPVVGEVVGEVGRGPVRAHQHPIALVTECLAGEPLRVVLVGKVCPAARNASSTSATSPRACSVRSENHVSNARRSVRDRPAERRRSRRSPTPRRRPRSRCRRVRRASVREIDDVLALVAVLRRFLPPITSNQRRRERVELRAGIVQVVLAVDLGTLRRQQVGDRVPDRDPPTAAGVGWDPWD